MLFNRHQVLDYYHHHHHHRLLLLSSVVVVVDGGDVELVEDQDAVNSLLSSILLAVLLELELVDGNSHGALIH